jgi:pilus assembly protein Flp/PilA
MSALARIFRLRNEDGQAMVEYALIVTLIAVVVLIVLIAMGNQVHNMYCNISGSLAS